MFLLDIFYQNLFYLQVFRFIVKLISIKNINI